VSISGRVLRQVAAVALVVVAVSAAGRLALGSTAPWDASAVATPSAAPRSEVVVDRSQATPATLEDWRAVVNGLYRRRAEAFSTSSPQLLDDVYAGGSPLLTADAGFASSLADAGERLRGYLPTVEQVTSAHPDGDRVRLELVDSWPAYEVVAAGEPGEAVLRTVPARPSSSVDMVLVRAGGSWLIESAERQG
jgi:hypothetical protein